MQSRSLAGRAVLAVALMVGFYVLALAMIGGLLFIPYAEVAYAHHLHLKLAFGCVVGALAIAWSILPRRDAFAAPGPTLHEAEQPRLFERLRDIAARTGQAMPREVFLVSEMNAWVANRGGVMGFGSRRVMGLGLPLLQATDVEQFEAILAHEFGHYHGGDTRLGPWIHKTRSAIVRTLASLGDGWLQLPFRWYGTLFMRITQAISRAQELSADRLAATVVGAGPLIEGLKRVHAEGAAFDAYWRQEAVPLLQAGFVAPLAEGFTRFLQVPRVRAAVEQTLADQLESGKGDPFDSHPPLPERIAALRPLLAEGAPGAGSGTSAISLLDDVAGSERALVGFLAKGADVSAFRPLDWDDTTATVYVPSWRREAERVAACLGTATFADLPALVTSRGAELAREILGQTVAVPDELVAQVIAGPLGCCLATALIDAGWTPSAAIGEPVTVRRGDAVIEPFAIVPRLGAEADAAAWWTATVAAHGTAGLRLAPALPDGDPGQGAGMPAGSAGSAR